LASEKVAIVII